MLQSVTIAMASFDGNCQNIQTPFLYCDFRCDEGATCANDSSTWTRRNEQDHNYRQTADVLKNPSNVSKIKDDGQW